MDIKEVHNIKVCAAIVTYNRVELLKNAIESLRNQEYKCDILVVNNGSTDETSEFLNLQKDIIVINQNNVGGAGGFYTALKYIAEYNYNLAWVMDDDIIAYPDTLSKMIFAYKKLEDAGEHIGFLCSKVENSDGISVNMPAIDFRPNITGYCSWNKRLNYGLMLVQSATFVSVLIPTGNIRNFGLPYKEFFIWGDDTEYTMRLSAHLTCYQVGASRIRHLRYGGHLSIWSINERNRIKMWRFFVRNHMFISKQGYFGVRGFYKYLSCNILTMLKLLLRCDFFKLKYSFIGFCKGLVFNPKIEYPKSSCD